MSKNTKEEIAEELDKEIDSVGDFAAQASQTEDPQVEAVDAEYAQIQEKGVSAGDLYYDEINDEVYRIEDIDGGIATVSYDNKHEWDETVEDVEDKIDDGDWIPVNESDEPARKANSAKPYHRLVARNGDVFTGKAEAQKRAKSLGLESAHSYQPDDAVLYGPGKTIAHYREAINKQGHPSCVKGAFGKNEQATVSHLLDKGKNKEEAHIAAKAIGDSSLVVKDNDEGLEDACWEGYTAEGMKPDPNGDGMVPNCVEKDGEDPVEEKEGPAKGVRPDWKQKLDGRRPDYKERMDKDEDPCWDGYEMAGTKVQDGEKVPNCVEKSTEKNKSGRRPDWQERMDKDEDPCWDGYEMAGTKVQDGEKVPNCVEKSDDNNEEDPVKAARKAFEDFRSTPTGVGGRVTLENKSVEIPDNPVKKDWIPYQGPQGGEGWQNSQNMDDIRYQEEAPGEIREDYQDFVEENDWGTDSQGNEDLDVGDYWGLEDENTTDFAHGPENAVDTTEYNVSPEDDPERFRESEASDRLLEGLKSGQVAGFTTLANLTTRGQNGYNPRDENVNMVGLKSRNLEGEEVQNLSKDTIIDFYEDNADILSESPAFRIGGYKFPNEDKMSLDVVAAVEDDEEARELGEMADQWSFVNLREVAKEGWGEGETELGGAGEDTLETKEEIMSALEDIDSLKKAILTALRVHGVMGNGGDRQMVKDEGAPQRYIHEESGTEQSVYDLAIGARHAELDKDPDEGPEGAVRFNGDLYVPVDTE